MRAVVSRAAQAACLLRLLSLQSPKALTLNFPPYRQDGCMPMEVQARTTHPGIRPQSCSLASMRSWCPQQPWQPLGHEST